MTRLTTLVQVAIGILVILLGSQAALWAEYGNIRGQLARVTTQVDHLTTQVDHLTTQVDQIARAVVHH
jgi:outer membrane murein-binding lipoprotein Lpp